MKILFLLVFFLCSAAGISQPLEHLPVNKLPKKLEISGKPKKAFTWVHNDTTNYLVYSESGAYKSFPYIKDSIDGYLNGQPVYTQEYGMYTSDYYVQHYKMYKSMVIPSWTIADRVKECYFDTKFTFISNAVSVTDLNNDGIQELWFMYNIGCVSDVSPLNLKLIMYEGNTKHIIRGLTKDYGNKTIDADSYKKVDSDLLYTEEKFRDYSLNLWKENNELVYE